jgi:hypothetical protein
MWTNGFNGARLPRLKYSSFIGLRSLDTCEADPYRSDFSGHLPLK